MSLFNNISSDNVIVIGDSEDIDEDLPPFLGDEDIVQVFL
jgi:hypothetical protein